MEGNGQLALGSVVVHTLDQQPNHAGPIGRSQRLPVLSAISSQFRRLEESENALERKGLGCMNRPSVWTSAVSLATMRVSTHSSRQGDGDVIIPPARLSVRLFRCLRFDPGQALRPAL